MVVVHFQSKCHSSESRSTTRRESIQLALDARFREHDKSFFEYSKYTTTNASLFFSPGGF